MNILSNELYKIFNRKRSYIGFVAVLAIVFLVLLAFKYEGREIFSFLTKNFEQQFILKGNILNGNMFAYLILKSLWVHFPILIALVTGDLISGEEQSGTIRLILSRPVGRVQFITAKFVAAFIYVISLVLFMAVVSLCLGYLTFGTGDLLVLMNTVNVFPADEVLQKFVGAYMFGIVSMMTIASLSIFLSATTGNSLAAILSTIALVIVLTFVSVFNVPGLNFFKPFLFTSYTSSWQGFFEYNLSPVELLWDVAVLLIYMAGFYLATLFYFKQKDIVS